MNYIDLILFLPFIYGVYRGFTKGLIYEAATLAALILGVYGAFKFSNFTTDFIVNNFGATGENLPWISFAITFVLIVIVVHLIAKVLTTVLKAVALGFINQFLGIIFSIFKIAFILSVVLVIFDPITKNSNVVSEESKSKSLLYYPIKKIAPSLFPYLHMDNIKIEFDKLKKDKSTS